MSDEKLPGAPRKPSDITQARIGVRRAGCGLPTDSLLAFQLDHARAREAVHAALDTDALLAHPAFEGAAIVASEAASRAAFLQRPDRGRRLAPGMAERLPPGPWDLAIVIGDGLSATAAQRHAAPMLEALYARLSGWRIAPPVIAHQARVALADEIAEHMQAGIALILIGERPGLSSADSLGAYLTYAPHVGRRDHERNCVSNIRPPHGLDYDRAATMIAWLLVEARRRGLSGVALKDESVNAASAHLP